jgi:predicted nucleic acid-binding protein
MEFEKIIADTCIWIEFFKGRAPFSDELMQLIKKGQIVITGPIIYELLQGAKNKKDADLIKEVAQALPIVEVATTTWVLAGDLFFDLRRKGVTLPPSDVLLSAVAIENNYSLFTVDNHFNHIPRICRYATGRPSKRLQE